MRTGTLGARTKTIGSRGCARSGRAQADSALFQSPTQYPGFPGLGHGAVVSGDFNGDGSPDLAVADLAAGGVRVLLNRCDGSFAPAAFYPTGAGAAAVTAADFTGHGHIDLVVANMLDSTVVLLTNRGDGTFIRGATNPTSPLPGRILTADFNGDGRRDLRADGQRCGPSQPGRRPIRSVTNSHGGHRPQPNWLGRLDGHRRRERRSSTGPTGR